MDKYIDFITDTKGYHYIPFSSTNGITVYIREDELLGKKPIDITTMVLEKSGVIKNGQKDNRKDT